MVVPLVVAICVTGDQEPSGTVGDHSSWKGTSVKGQERSTLAPAREIESNGLGLGGGLGLVRSWVICVDQDAGPEGNALIVQKTLEFVGSTQVVL